MTAHVWDAETGKLVVALKAPAGRDPHQYGYGGMYGSACFSPDNRRVLTAYGDKLPTVWDAETGKELLVFKGHTAPVGSANISPDGKRVVTASLDGTARIWDAETGRRQCSRILPVTRKCGVINAIFSPSGQRVVTTTDGCVWSFSEFNSGHERLKEEKTIGRIWETVTGNEVMQLDWPDKNSDAFVRTAVFCADGRRPRHRRHHRQLKRQSRLSGAGRVGHGDRQTPGQPVGSGEARHFRRPSWSPS